MRQLFGVIAIYMKRINLKTGESVNLAHHENDSGYSKADGSSVKERS